MTHPTPDSLGAYLDGELDPAARAALEAHLGGCDECSAHLADLAAVDEAARQVPLVVPDGYFEDFAPRVRARLEKRPAARWRPPVWGWAAAAALLLGVVTPLALREAHAPRDASEEPERPPASPAGGEFKQEPEAATAAPERRVEAGRDAGLQKKAGRLADAVPEAPAAKAASPDAGARANTTTIDDGLLRRDQPALRTRRAEPAGAAMGGAAAAPAVPPATTLAAPAEERAKREQDAFEGFKLSKQDEDKRAESGRALGYVAPPPPPQVAANAKAKESKTAPEAKLTLQADAAKDKAQPTDAVAEKSTLDGMQESVTVTQERQAFARGPESMKFRTLVRSLPRSDAEARVLREAWRTFASDHPDLPEADEARVRLVEVGALAYRLGRKPQDREVALRDAREYLERPKAPQAERIRTALKTLETPGDR